MAGSASLIESYPILFREIDMPFRPYLFAAALLFLSAGANAQDRPGPAAAAAIKADCAKELKSQCRGVQEGRGRLLACLYARDKSLSPKCATTVADSAEQLVEALSAVNSVRRACDADLKRHCMTVLPGNGKLVDCLTGFRRSVAQACGAALDTASLRP
jgi:hypothetical protein